MWNSLQLWLLSDKHKLFLEGSQDTIAVCFLKSLWTLLQWFPKDGADPQVAWSYCTRRRSMQSIFIFWYFLQLFVTEYHRVCPLVMFQCSTQTSDCYYLNPAWSHVSLWICMLIHSYLKINQPEGYFSEQIQVQTNFWFDLQTSLSPKLLHRTVRSSVWDNDSGVHTRYRK